MVRSLIAHYKCRDAEVIMIFLVTFVLLVLIILQPFAFIDFHVSVVIFLAIVDTLSSEYFK